ncbi:MAG: glycosyltransferase, partial [Clostridiales bacterium]|nr:glycosyltransferase [Clostridiales bacterium]
LFYLGRYKEALRELYKVIDEKYYNPSVYCCILCELFTKNYNQVEKLLKITEEFNEPEERMVYKSFISI